MRCGPDGTQVQRASDEVVEVDVVGIDPPIANALRRIMIAEIPTIAIEKCYVYQNTGVIHDEVSLDTPDSLELVITDPRTPSWSSPYLL